MVVQQFINDKNIKNLIFHNTKDEENVKTHKTIIARIRIIWKEETVRRSWQNAVLVLIRTT